MMKWNSSHECILSFLVLILLLCVSSRLSRDWLSKCWQPIKRTWIFFGCPWTTSLISPPWRKRRGSVTAGRETSAKAAGVKRITHPLAHLEKRGSFSCGVEMKRQFLFHRFHWAVPKYQKRELTRTKVEVCREYVNRSPNVKVLLSATEGYFFIVSFQCNQMQSLTLHTYTDEKTLASGTFRNENAGISLQGQSTCSRKGKYYLWYALEIKYITECIHGHVSVLCTVGISIRAPLAFLPLNAFAAVSEIATGGCYVLCKNSFTAEVFSIKWLVNCFFFSLSFVLILFVNALTMATWERGF